MSADPGTPRKRRSDGEETRRRVLAAAIESILEIGYYKTSTNEIARRAGVTWGTLQYQFGTRDALLLAVLNDRWDFLQQTLAQAEIGGETLEERLGEVLAVLNGYYGIPAHLAQLQIVLDLSQSPDTSDEVREAVAEHGRRLTRAWKPLFDRALGAAGSEPDLVRFAFTSLRGYLTGHLVSSRIAQVSDDRATRALLVRGIAAAIREEASDRGYVVQ